MTKTLVVLAALLGLASAATAQSVVTEPVGFTTLLPVGQTLSIRVTASAQGASDNAIFGRLAFSNPSIAQIDTGLPQQSTLIATNGTPWTNGATSCNATGCVMFNSVFPAGATTVSNTLVSTVSFVATTPGATTVAWVTSPPGSALDFFGITNAPGFSFTVVPATPAPIGRGAGFVTAGLLLLVAGLALRSSWSRASS